jgi:hypothetical protein
MYTILLTHLHAVQIDKRLLFKNEKILNNPIYNFNFTSPVDPSIKNIVATINLGSKVNLRVISKKCKNTEYNPKAKSWLTRMKMT